MDPLDLTAAPHPRFPAQGHILSAGVDALREPLQHPRETRDGAALPAPNTHSTSKLPQYKRPLSLAPKNALLSPNPQTHDPARAHGRKKTKDREQQPETRKKGCMDEIYSSIYIDE